MVVTVSPYQKAKQTNHKHLPWKVYWKLVATKRATMNWSKEPFFHLSDRWKHHLIWRKALWWTEGCLTLEREGTTSEREQNPPARPGFGNQDTPFTLMFGSRQAPLERNPLCVRGSSLLANHMKTWSCLILNQGLGPSKSLFRTEVALQDLRLTSFTSPSTWFL